MPQHPFVDYKSPISNTTSPQKNNSNTHSENETILTKELFENLQLKPISHQEMIEKKKHQVTKPKEIEETKDKQYPKIRVSLNVMNQLKRYQKQMKCKSYCEVVMKLMEFYESHNDISIVNKSDEL